MLDPQAIPCFIILVAKIASKKAWSISVYIAGKFENPVCTEYQLFMMLRSRNIYEKP